MVVAGYGSQTWRWGYQHLTVTSHYNQSIGLAKHSSGCFCKMLWKNVNECFGQPNKSQLFVWTFTLCNKTELAFISFSNLTYNNLATPRATFSLVLYSPNSLLGQCVFHYFSLHLNCLCCSECAFADNPSWGTLTPICSLLDTLCFFIVDMFISFAYFLYPSYLLSWGEDSFELV